jgi:hypothetical protein
LSNLVKNKTRIIENLKFKNEELVSYKNGYEMGIKQIKRDMLVLKFINKTKTNLLRKYTLKMKDVGKFFDHTDLRKPILEYLNSHPVSFNALHTENLYIKNQLKQLTDAPKAITTAHTIEFFLKVVD